MPDKTALSVNMQQKYRSIEAGSDVYIMGRGFLDTPGKIQISVAGQQVPITPEGKNWWSNYGIRFKVGQIPGYLSRDIGTLTIQTATGQTISNISFSFIYGPEMTVKVVSGKKWLEPEWDEDSSYAEPDDHDLVLFVSHDPGCGIFASSENGNDHFFRKLKLPKGVMLSHFSFIEIQHEDSQNQMKYLKNYLKDLLFSMDGLGFLDAALGVITKNLKLLLQSLGDALFGDGGGYFAQLAFMPQNNVDCPHIQVKWENSCTGTTGGLPIMYMTTFVVTGPKTVLDNM
jgi:hypothetical protein